MAKVELKGTGKYSCFMPAKGAAGQKGFRNQDTTMLTGPAFSTLLSRDDSLRQELPPSLQQALAQGAMQRVAALLAEHVELLAAEMDAGALLDQGGPDALRLFVVVVWVTNDDGWATVGNA